MTFTFHHPMFRPTPVEADTLKQARRRFARLCGSRKWDDLTDTFRKVTTVTTGPTAEVPCRDTH